MHIGRLLRLIQQEQSRTLDFEETYNLTGPLFSVLSAVVSGPGLDQRSISAQTFVDKSTLASAVSQLVDKGLVYASRSPLDGRKDRLLPAASAVRLVYEATPVLLGRNDDFLAALTARERTGFLEALEAVAYADDRERPAKYVVPSPDGMREPLEVTWGPGRLFRASLQRYGRLWSARISDLTPLQWPVLNALALDNDIDQKTLGEAIRMDKASVTEMLGRLSRRNLVIKVPDPSDRRRRVLRLTAEGRGLIREREQQITCVDDDFLSPLNGQQRDVFIGAMRKLAQTHDIAEEEDWIAGHVPTAHVSSHPETAKPKSGAYAAPTPAHS